KPYRARRQEREEAVEPIARRGRGFRRAWERLRRWGHTHLVTESSHRQAGSAQHTSHMGGRVLDDLASKTGDVAAYQATRAKRDIAADNRHVPANLAVYLGAAAYHRYLAVNF